jgi:hypothetical protein
MNGYKLLIPGVLSAALVVSTGCGGDFNYGKVGNMIQASPMRLDAEYVMLTPQQMDCGVQNDLWEAPVANGSRTLARLTQKGRDLKFAEDVSVGDMKLPYVQVRGEFSLVVVDIQSDQSGPEKDSKLVDVKLGVPITHSCFPQPLPMMGVRKGDFTQAYPPVLYFRYNNGWYVDRIVH